MRKLKKNQERNFLMPILIFKYFYNLYDGSNLSIIAYAIDTTIDITMISLSNKACVGI